AIINRIFRVDDMAKIPDQPQDIFVPLTQDYLQAFGKDLVSLMLYGSAAGGSYVKGKSDINILVVLTEEGINRLEDGFTLVKNWRKRNVAVPLVMTKQFITSSLDSYPIEFLNMQSNSVLIHGENVLESLVFKPEDLRLQIERELKSKILMLREGYLESEGSARQLRQLISKSLTAFVSIFNAMLFLKQTRMPRDKRETIKEMNKAFTIDDAVFMLCFEIRQNTDKLSIKEVTDVFKKYLREVEKASHIIDGL
ncbi:MAG: putative cytosolic protein, partial [Firmicutes bacterium]|nr:putative cytosolic protein [Bacillota bacterium]